jgi:hypothetical protein
MPHYPQRKKPRRLRWGPAPGTARCPFFCDKDRVALPRHAVVANSGQLTRQERSLGRRRRRAESDPDVWSGRASQEVLPIWRCAVLHQCIRPRIGVHWLRAIMDISARAISLADGPRTGHLGHQCSHAPGRPILHLVSSSRRPRRVRCLALYHRELIGRQAIGC